MIRFLNLKDQIQEGSNDFAFYDTVSNKILSFGEDEEQIFDCLEYFKDCYGEEGEGSTRSLRRFISLIPDDYFEK